MPIHFKCPCCGAEHTRGFIDLVSVFRCLKCGYMGYGFHPDKTIDEAVFADHEQGNAFNRAHGIDEVPLGIDPRDFAS
jgi:rubredoxin